MFVSLLYFFRIQQTSKYKKLHPIIMLYFIVGMEMILTLPCLAYYISEFIGGGGREEMRREEGIGWEEWRERER